MANEKSKKWTRKRIVLLIIVIVVLVLLYQPFYAEMLKAAIADNNMGRVKVILAVPGNVNYYFSAPLLEASSKTPLAVACMDDNYEMIELLLKNGAKPNQAPGYTQPLEFVLAGNYEGLLERTNLLVEYGAEINIGDGSDMQPIESLFRRYDFMDFKDKSTLEKANAEVFATMVYLAEHGAYIEAYSPFRTYRRLLNTVENENYDAIVFLVSDHGININLQDVTGETVLIEATKLGNLGTVKLLLALGADVSIRDNKDKTALDYAIEYDFTDIANHLENE